MPQSKTGLSLPAGFGAPSSWVWSLQLGVPQKATLTVGRVFAVESWCDDMCGVLVWFHSDIMGSLGLLRRLGARAGSRGWIVTAGLGLGW